MLSLYIVLIFISDITLSWI